METERVKPKINIPEHENLVLIAYAQMSLSNTHAGVSSEASSLSFDLSLYLHPYFVYASCEGYGESWHMCRPR